MSDESPNTSYDVVAFGTVLDRTTNQHHQESKNDQNFLDHDGNSKTIFTIDRIEDGNMYLLEIQVGNRVIKDEATTDQVQIDQKHREQVQTIDLLCYEDPRVFDEFVDSQTPLESISTPRTLSSAPVQQIRSCIIIKKKRRFQLPHWHGLCDKSLLHLRFSVHRLFTFPLDFPLSTTKKHELSESGFYLTSFKQSVQCFHCKVEIVNFADIVDANAAHKLANPSCELIAARNVGNVPIGDVTYYQFEAYRLYSLLISDWSWPVCPYQLAKNGFYWTGTSDIVRCAFCRMELGNWEPGQSIIGAHQTNAPECPLLNIKSGARNINMGNEVKYKDLSRKEVNWWLSSVTPHIYLCYLNPFRVQSIDSFPTFKTLRKRGLHPTFAELGFLILPPIAFKMYSSLLSRINTFQRVSKSLPVPHEELAKAGLFYSGPEDEVCCFCCGGGLKNWEAGHDPWVTHCLWYPKCPYVLYANIFVPEMHPRISKSVPPVDEIEKENESKKNHVNECENQQSSRFPKRSTNDLLNEVPVHQCSTRKRKFGKTEDHKKDAATVQNSKGTNEITKLTFQCAESADVKIMRDDDHGDAIPTSESDRMICLSCKTRDINTVNYPCTHMDRCSVCFEENIHCMRCNGVVVVNTRVFLP